MAHCPAKGVLSNEFHAFNSHAQRIRRRRSNQRCSSHTHTHTQNTHTHPKHHTTHTHTHHTHTHTQYTHTYTIHTYTIHTTHNTRTHTLHKLTSPSAQLHNGLEAADFEQGRLCPLCAAVALQVLATSVGHAHTVQNHLRGGCAKELERRERECVCVCVCACVVVSVWRECKAVLDFREKT